MQIIYRISDNGYRKPKLPGASRRLCLQNCLTVFAGFPLVLIADHVTDPETEQLLNGLCVHRTQLGNAGSLRYAIDLALAGNEELIYMVEDDYLHHPLAPQVLLEGQTEYLTLYDHPDKYTAAYGFGEESRVTRTPSAHWRSTASTCMTFATKKKYLQEDRETWWKYTNEFHPHDHQIFTELKAKGRRLSVCLPGLACHTDLTFSGLAGEVLMEPWAIQICIDELERQLGSVDQDLLNGISGWKRLVRLEAIREYSKRENGSLFGSTEGKTNELPQNQIQDR